MYIYILEKHKQIINVLTLKLNMFENVKLLRDKLLFVICNV